MSSSGQDDFEVKVIRKSKYVGVWIFDLKWMVSTECILVETKLLVKAVA